MHALVVAPWVSPVVADPVVLEDVSAVVVVSSLAAPLPSLEPAMFAVLPLGPSVALDDGEVPNDPPLSPNALPSSVPEVHAAGSHSTHTQLRNPIGTTIPASLP